jgi:hypothetical protein
MNYLLTEEPSPQEAMKQRLEKCEADLKDQFRLGLLEKAFNEELVR